MLATIFGNVRLSFECRNDHFQSRWNWGISMVGEEAYENFGYAQRIIDIQKHTTHSGSWCDVPFYKRGSGTPIIVNQGRWKRRNFSVTIDF